VYNVLLFKQKVMPCYNSIFATSRTSTLSHLCVSKKCVKEVKRNGFYRWAYASKCIATLRLLLVFPTSLTVTEGILVSFCCFAALTDMFKFSAYTRLSWCDLEKSKVAFSQCFLKLFQRKKKEAKQKLIMNSWKQCTHENCNAKKSNS